MTAFPFALDVGLPPALDQVGSAALLAESAGFSGVWAAETGIDPMLSMVAAASATTTLNVGTAITVAFARSPMVVASEAWELARLSNGRFVLGLGTQVKAHITKRYSMPWSPPGQRMAEYIGALNAIWHSWSTGEPLAFRGEFYTHTLMTPFFAPPPLPSGLTPPKILVAAVGPSVAAVARQHCNGIHVHPFSTPLWIRDVLLDAQPRPDGFEIAVPVFVCDTSQPNADQIVGAIRARIAFYGSTPAYSEVLNAVAGPDLHPQLHAMSKRGEWEAMAALIDDATLDAFSVSGTPSQIVDALVARYQGLATRIVVEDHAIGARLLESVR
jgi:probable F420-dependent oxidoreductase